MLSVKEHKRYKKVPQPIENESLEQLLTIVDVMTLLQVSRPMVYDLIGQGLPSLKFGRARRFRPGALRDWLMNRERIG